MKKSSFVAMVLGTISVVLFALGMCMALLPAWNAFRPGVILGCVGLAAALGTVLVWRRMEHKSPVRIGPKLVLAVLMGAAGALTLGTGMCLSMVWDRMIPGIAVGLIGIVILLCLIPVAKGVK